MSEAVTPVLIERADDLGWLALTPPTYKLRFGIHAPDREQALAQFDAARFRWESIGSDRPVEPVEP